MRRFVVRVVEALSLPTIGLAIVAVLAPGRLALATHVWLLVVSAIALLGVLSALRRAYPIPSAPRSTRRSTGRPRPTSGCPSSPASSAR